MAGGTTTAYALMPASSMAGMAPALAVILERHALYLHLSLIRMCIASLLSRGRKCGKHRRSLGVDECGSPVARVDSRT
jgi:hypothetical protein